jgi:glucoamylase
MEANISPSDSLKGTVIASPSTSNPNYRYHWVRDAALTMDVILQQIPHSNFEQTLKYESMFFDFINLTELQQRLPNRSRGLGEPKFNIDGTTFDAEWGRPQNDSPALRASVLINFANYLLNSGRIELVRKKLYDGKFPTDSVIKKDLEFVANHWQESSFDLWEEVNGQHFYTLTAQRAALLAGARLATNLNDPGAANYYIIQAEKIKKILNDRYWDYKRNYFVATKNRLNGPDRESGLDIAVILAALHSEVPGEADQFGVIDDRILATAYHLETQFKKIYSLNFQNLDLDLGTAIGRYPEDTYDGYATDSKGNPWFISTNAFAELYFRAANNYLARKVITINDVNLIFFRNLTKLQNSHLVSPQVVHSSDPLFKKIIEALIFDGNKFIHRVLNHTNSAFELSEQFNKDTGLMQGAPHLTWSYASYITAIKARPSHSTKDIMIDQNFN